MITLHNKNLFDTFEFYQIQNSEDAYIMHIPVVGHNKDTVDVFLDGSHLFIKANKENASSIIAENINYKYRMPIEFIDKNAINAKIEDGVLLVTIPKKEKEKRQKRITVS